MLKVRVIPTLLWKDVGLVKGIRFASDRRVGPMVPAVRVYAGRDVDELILVDVAASDRGAGPDLQLCAEAADEAPVPLTFGGGITSAAHVGALLAAGADKVSINTCAVESPSLITEAAHLFGSQCIVVSIDALAGPDGRYEVVTRSGSSTTQLQAEEWARECEERGAGEILLTAVHRDGTREGYDLQLIRSVADSVTIPPHRIGRSRELRAHARGRAGRRRRSRCGQHLPLHRADASRREGPPRAIRHTRPKGSERDVTRCPVRICSGPDRTAGDPLREGPVILRVDVDGLIAREDRGDR